MFKQILVFEFLKLDDLGPLSFKMAIFNPLPNSFMKLFFSR